MKWAVGNSPTLVFLAALAVLFGVVGYADANLVTNGSFETGSTVDTQLPNTFEVWAGDQTTIVGAENGITPFQGTQMVRFDRTLFTTTGGTDSALWQLIDMTPFQTAIDKGIALFHSSVRVNRIAGDADTDTQFRHEIQAFAGDPSNFSSDVNGNFLGLFRTDLFSDSNPHTWQLMKLNFFLPAGTTYVGWNVTAVENVDSTDSPPFDGHYADSAFAMVSPPVSPPVPNPEPGTLLLLGSGVVAIAVGLMARRRNHRK